MTAVTRRTWNDWYHGLYCLCMGRRYGNRPYRFLQTGTASVEPLWIIALTNKSLRSWN